MIKPEDLSKKQLQALIWKGMNRCPVCGGTPSVRSPKGKLCEFHVELKTANKSRSEGYASRHIPLSVYEKADWSLGVKALAKQFGVKVLAIRCAYTKLVGMRRIKPVKGIMRSRLEFQMEVKRKAEARRAERELLNPKKPKTPPAQSQNVDPERIAYLLPLLLRKQPHERTRPVDRCR